MSSNSSMANNMRAKNGLICFLITYSTLKLFKKNQTENDCMTKHTLVNAVTDTAMG
jgi:hypothetical protein